MKGLTCSGNGTTYRVRVTSILASGAGQTPTIYTQVLTYNHPKVLQYKRFVFTIHMCMFYYGLRN